MPSTAEKLSPTRVKLTIEIPFSDLKPHLEKAYKDIAEQVNIPGFRKGKVPAAVIDQRFGRGGVLQEAINDAIPPAYNAAIDEAKVIPMAQPEVEVTKLEDKELIEFVAEVDVRPEITLPDFATVTATVDNVEDLDEMVQERLDILRERFATTTEVDRAAADGDVLNIDLVASQDGEPLPEATAEAITYKIGQENMLEGLDAAVTGLKAGESVTFTSTLVGGQFRGQDAEIDSLVSIRNGEQYMTVFKDTNKLAEAAIILAEAIVKGQTPNIPGAVLASGDLKEIGNTGKKYVNAYLLDPISVTKTNSNVPVDAGFYTAEEMAKLK